MVKRFVGSSYIEFVAFPSQFTEAQALAAIAIVQQQPYVEQVVASSSSFVVYYHNELAHGYLPNETIPETTRRGLDSGPASPFDPSVILLPHVRNRLSVSWKADFIWNA